MAKLRLRPYGARDKPSPIIGKGGKPFVEGALKQQGLERQQDTGDWYFPKKFKWYNPLSYRVGWPKLLSELGEFASPVRGAERITAFAKGIWQKGFVPLSKKIAGGIAPHVVPERELPGVLKELGVYKQRKFGEEYKETFGEALRTVSPAFIAGEIGMFGKGIKGLTGGKLLSRRAIGPKGMIARTLERIPRVGKFLSAGYHQTFRGISAPFRTKLAQKVIRPIGTAATRAGAKTYLAEPLLSKEEQKSIRELRLMEHSGTRLALEFGVGAMVAVPFMGDILSKAVKFNKNVLMVAGKEDIIKSVDDYFTSSDKAFDFYKRWGSRNRMYGAVAQYAAKRGIPIEHVDTTVVNDFFKTLTASGTKLKEIPGLNVDDIARLAKHGIDTTSDFYNKHDNVANLIKIAPKTHGRIITALESAGRSDIERGVFGGAWQNIKGDKITQMKHFDAVFKSGKILGPAQKQAIEKLYEASKTQRFGEKLTQAKYMNRYKYFEKVPNAIKLGANKFETMLGKTVSQMRTTQAGKFFTTHPNTYQLSSEMIRLSDENIIKSLGKVRGRKVINSIQKDIRNTLDGGWFTQMFGPKSRLELVSWNPLKPYRQLETVINRSGAFSKGQVTETAKQVWNAVLDAQFAVNKKHAMFSVGEWIGAKIPLVRPVQKFYNAMRFMARPTYHLQQLPETWIWGSADIAKMKNPMAREIASRFVSQPVLVNALDVEFDLMQHLDPLAIERGATNYDLLGGVKSRGVHFVDTWIDEIEKTPWFVKTGKRSAYNLPEVKVILDKLNVADNPIVELSSILKANPDIPVGELGIAFSRLKGKQAWTMVRGWTLNKAWRATKARAIPIQLYDAARTPAERALHHILFPTSYVKKVVTKAGEYLVGGSAIRPMAAREILNSYTTLLRAVEERAEENPQWKWLNTVMTTFDPFSAEYPLGFGGLTPFVRMLAKMQAKPHWYNVTSPEGIDHSLSTLLPAYKEWTMKYPELLKAIFKEEASFGRGTFYFPELEDEKWEELEAQWEKLIQRVEGEEDRELRRKFQPTIKTELPIPKPIGVYEKKKKGSGPRIPTTILPVLPPR